MHILPFSKRAGRLSKALSRTLSRTLSRILSRTLHVRSVFSMLSVFISVFIGLAQVSAQTQAESLSTAPPIRVNTKHFRPPIDAFGLLTVERAFPLEHLKLNLSLLIDTERDSLSFKRSRGSSYAALEQLTTGQFSVTLGLWSRIHLGVSLPLHILKSDLDGPDGTPSSSTDGVGDASLSMKGIIFNSAEYPVGLAVLIHSYWTFTSTPLTLLADQANPTLEPWLILDSEWRWATLALNVGYRAREPGELRPLNVAQAGEGGASLLGPVLDPITLGPEALYRVGLAIHYSPQYFHHCFEITGARPLGVEGATRAERLELISGLKLIFNRGSHLAIGGARGLIDGYSKPAWRAFMGISFHPTSSDRDQDGIVDSRDRCPREPEDMDQFEDRDGCPDPDNDGDGFLDLFDQCPNEPEDVNGFEDQDGCPDRDQDLDQDGILDSKDECPERPEDFDQYLDTDGCPDPDNDADQILDRVDRCPNDPEDFDRFEDEDGCPDRDNDQDQIPDDQDRCPDTPEDRDGDADEDGCPERDTKRVTDEGARLNIEGKVFFDSSKATIKPESYSLLKEIAQFLNDRPQIKLIEVQGHTDQRGRRAYNIDLSERRAAAVRAFLVNECDVSAERLESRGYGPDRPLNEANTPSAHAQNRRVEFVVLERDRVGD